ncbi:MAG: hypothetical protein ACUVV5_09855 [Candidatus Aminicenantales bacterium]
MGKSMIRPLLSLEHLPLDEREGKVCYQYGQRAEEVERMDHLEFIARVFAHRLCCRRSHYQPSQASLSHRETAPPPFTRNSLWPTMSPPHQVACQDFLRDSVTPAILSRPGGAFHGRSVVGEL